MVQGDRRGASTAPTPKTWFLRKPKQKYDSTKQYFFDPIFTSFFPVVLRVFMRSLLKQHKTTPE
jgi:hypothetical protein